MIKRLQHHLFLLTIPLLILSQSVFSQSTEYKFGVFPYIPPEKVEVVWSPLIAQLVKDLGSPIQLRTRSSYSNFRNAIENEEFDIAFMQPFVYTNVAAKHGYTPLARFISLRDKQQKGLLRAIFVTRKENVNLKISDLKGKLIATPPNTAAVTILGKELLRKHGLIAGRDYNISTHINHHACLRQLIINKPIVCITAHPPYARYNTQIHNRLAIMAYSDPIPTSLIAIHKRVPQKDKAVIQNTLLHLEEKNYTQEFLQKARLTNFIPTTDEDYDSVREIWKRIN